MSATAEANLVRPLRVLEELIREQLDAADRAANDAAEPYYRKAAPLLAEAKEGHFHSDTAGFYEWAQKKFPGKTRERIRTWTAFGTSSYSKSFKHITEFTATPRAQGCLGRTNEQGPRIRRDWAAPAAEVADRARREAFRLAQEDSLTRAQEREAERKLAGRLIDIGYKVLAKAPPSTRSVLPVT